MIQLKNEPMKVIKLLNQHGFKAYLVGGCLRDYLLSKEPQDFDIATDAKPEDVIHLFEKTIPTGIKHGTVTVIINGVKIEVTTFRVEKEYENHRWPKVEFTNSLFEDLRRRDFTINAMAYHPDEGLIDYFGGIEDLKNKIVRCVGNPHERFFEDALRILRCIRFATQLSFVIENKTFEALKSLKHLLKKISKERINIELSKTLESKNSSYGLELLYESSVGSIIIPEYSQIYLYLSQVDFDFIPTKFKVPAFFACLKDGILVEKLMRDLKFEKKKINFAVKLCNYLTMECSQDKLVKKIFFEEEKEVEEILTTISILKSDHRILQTFNDLKRENKLIHKKDVQLSGKDLLVLGLRGEMIGKVLNTVYEYVLENPEKNSKDEILNYVNLYLQQGKN
ncbi:Polynucleotide adenylyltransferase region [Caldicellulosiruptor kronotskyensis 2002]|uniref:Polynucleotide adenylyltransferase region n=1 Tax=Caldicellulosiruptor kronotskyensis (strain DSM 18902 / VKM B-2412 / 2002) TaxID=632348 RepID=E4SB94_CALK2|nr:CCA tRNA nucleotidyltransferase [Caldicellulosiruptor kronotskyensis]ADQ45876.1 Polynucleotide adenylyltransferase region [Caldicellulosiruptor kronotskyensis 2002]